MLSACDFHRKREYQGQESKPPGVASAGNDATATGQSAERTATAPNTKPPAETPPAETLPAETLPTETASTVVPPGGGCDAVGAAVVNMRRTEMSANVPAEQREQFEATLVATLQQVSESCAAEKWDAEQRACIIGAASLSDMQLCVLPKAEDHPECAAAVDKLLAHTLAAAPEERRAQLQQILPMQRSQMVGQCVAQQWTPEVMLCVAATTTIEEAQACFDKMPPPQ